MENLNYFINCFGKTSIESNHKTNKVHQITKKKSKEEKNGNFSDLVEKFIKVFMDDFSVLDRHLIISLVI